MRTREIEEASSKAAPSFQLLIDCNDRQTFMRIGGYIERVNLLCAPLVFPCPFAQDRKTEGRVIEVVVLEKVPSIAAPVGRNPVASRRSR